MKFKGDIDIFLNSLGKYEGDKSILESICIISSDFEINFLSETEIDHMYYQFTKNGVDFLFNKNNNGYCLESIFFYFQGNDYYQDYSFKNRLINGVQSSIEKDSVILLFGRPALESINWVKYKIGSKFIHFEFNEKGIYQVSIFIE